MTEEPHESFLLRIMDVVEVDVAEDRHKDWCYDCQLSVPRVEITPGEGEREDCSSDPSVLQAIFDACWTDPELATSLRRDASLLAQHGVTLANNIIVRIISGSDPRIALVVGHHRHICTCAALDLYDLVYDS